MTSTDPRQIDQNARLRQEPSSPWAPFRHASFNVMWSATVVANVGTWMYNAGSGWLMTSLDPDPLIVSFLQVATTLPIFLLARPAGALADVVDRRRFLIAIEIATTAVSALFAAFVWLDCGHSADIAAVHFPDWDRRGADGPCVASDRAAARSQAGPCSGRGSQQRRLQHQPCNWSRARRRDHRWLWNRGTVLARRYQQPWSDRCPVVVAFAAKAWS